ncbi:hypothetical protein SGLAM104S_02096 [Streptomyces glaucescens]
MTAPWLCQSYPATQCAAVRIFVGATTAPPQKKPVSSEVSAVPLSSPYQSCAIQGAEVMVVVVPPMIFASAVCPVLPALYDDLAGRARAVRPRRPRWRAGAPARRPTVSWWRV